MRDRVGYHSACDMCAGPVGTRDILQLQMKEKYTQTLTIMRMTWVLAAWAGTRPAGRRLGAR